MPIDPAEENLIRRCRAGEAEAWEEVFRQHYGPVGRFVFQVSPSFSREDVEEITQEVFLNAIRHLPQFQGGCQLQTWLFRIALNKARDHAAHRAAAKRGGGQATISLDAEVEGDGPGLDLPGVQPAPDAALLSRERQWLVRQALDQIGDPCREILELRYFGELSYEELAQTLELNPKTVSSRLSKCLDRLEGVVRAVFSGENAKGYSV